MTEATAAFVARHARRNFWLNVIEGGLFMFGISMVSRFTVLPYFVEQYSQESWLQGLIPTIANTGWLLPGLFVAPLIAQLWRRKPVMLIGTFLERLPWLIIGIWLIGGNQFDASTTLLVFFGLYSMHMFSAGATSVPWQDFIGRVIPEHRWGTFFGMQSGFGSLLGVAGATVATQVLAGTPLVIGEWQILGTQSFPFSIGFLSLACFGCMMISYIFLALTVEPVIAPTQAKQPFWALIKNMPQVLRDDPGFTTYLVARVCLSLGMLGHSFVTAAALSKFEIDGSMVGAFTVALLAAQAVGNFGLGALSDRWGHRQVLILSGFLGSASLLLAWGAPNALWFFPIFILGGIALGGYQLSGFTMVMNFATTETRPIYIAVANTFNVPVSAIAPLAAGWLAGQYGYIWLFVVLAALGLVGVYILYARVQLPNHARAA
ncbi:MAG: MFS transporter [Chloroflexi bacterium]|nr:MFS transporter [Chloroflexota bacterium]